MKHSTNNNSPPHDPDVEKSVIGSIFLNPDVLEFVGVIIGPEDFYDRANAAVYLAARDCHEAGEPLDAVTVGQRLEANGKLADVGGVDAIRDYLETVPHAGHAEYYAGIVADKARRRRLLYSVRELADRAADPMTTDDDLAELAGRVPGLASGLRQFDAVVERLSDVERTQVEWLWPGRFPLGKLTLLAGDPGLGKSFITLDMASRISTGAGWPDDFAAGQPVGSVVLLSAEDDPADTIAPRLHRAGADLSRVHVLKGIRRDMGNGVRSFNLERDLPTLERTIRTVGNVRLVVIDPVSAYCGKTDSHKNADVRSLLAPLADLAAKHRVAVVAVTHLSKGAGGKAIYRAMGSLAFAAAARAVWAVVKDKDNPLRRLVLPVKNNLSAECQGLAYAIVDGVVAWEADPVEFSADDAFAAELERDNDHDNRGRLDEAMEWLTETLAAYSVLATEIPKWARNNGITPATLRRAKEKLGVKSKRVGLMQDSRVWWTLSDA